MEKYNIGDVWWVHFPYSDSNQKKRRPAIVIDEDTIAILAMYVTSKNKQENPFSISIDDWEDAGLPKESWTRIDKIVKVSEWDMDCMIGQLSDRDLTKIMQLVKEIINNKTHEFSLLAVKNSSGQFLQKYDNRWKSWLFPYVRSTEENKKNVDEYISKLLGMQLKAEYVTCAKHCKYSVSDDVYKIYNHKLYEVLFGSVPEAMNNDSFELNGDTYKWMSIQDMEYDTRIMEVNEEIVAFVKSKC